MRLPLHGWRNFWGKLGRRVVRNTAKPRHTAFETLDCRALLTASSVLVNPAPLPAEALI
ncbi:MAG TPA: hypothetical protein VGI75_03725 [Pirellulales bacterium]